jgi:hypothetical protein
MNEETTKTEVAKTESAQPLTQTSAEELISKAIEKGVPVETMERLLVMRRELKAEWAKEQFDIAFGKLQREMPVVRKTEAVRNKDGSAKYKFAPLEVIVPIVKDTISDNGFIYDFDTTDDGKMLTTTCKITHKSGHTKLNSFSVPIGAEQYMTEVQKFGARDTFCKRYAFLNGFGIIVEGEDKDATTEALGQGENNYGGAPRATTPRTYPASGAKTQYTPPKASDKQIWLIKKELERIGANEAWFKSQTGHTLESINVKQASVAIAKLIETKPTGGIQDAEIEYDEADLQGASVDERGNN